MNRPPPFPGALRLRGLLSGPLALLLLLTPTLLPAQVIPDTTGAIPDSARIMTPDDTLEGQEPQADTINPQDTLPAVQPPAIRSPIPAGWETGIWEWDREGILSSRAVSLVELLGEIPGMVLLRGGDYGMPATASAFGAGGGRIRVFRDGIELLPLEGSVPDLSRVGLGGLRSVRVVRSVTGIRVEIESVLAEGGKPYSLVEAGTGDLNSNLFRGTFSHPRAFGGVFVFSMQRLDTRGPRGEEPGVGQGAWVRYARPLPWDGAFIAEYGSRSSDRGDLYSPEKASRSDWSARARWTLLPGLVGDLSYASSSINTEKPDTFDFEPGSRTQLSAVLGYESEWVGGLARFRKLSGEGIPGSSAHLEARGTLGRFGGVSAETTWESWDGESVRKDRFRAWTAPLLGFSLFYERDSGDWGLPFLPGVSPEVPDPGDGAQDDPQDDPQDEPPPETFPAVVPGPRFSSQEGSRFGARFEWKGLSLAGALVETSADSLFLLGLPTDRGGDTQSGGTRSGFEVNGRIPLYPRGFALVGWWQKWDQAEDARTMPTDTASEPELLPEDRIPWRYLPRQSYQASLSFHDTFKPTGNLEVWFDLGVRGRDPMAVPLMEEVSTGDDEVRLVPTTVPFYQSWFVRLQIRIVTVRAFIMWENFTVRQQNQDFPGRILPATRSLYGVRWTLWN